MTSSSSIAHEGPLSLTLATSLSAESDFVPLWPLRVRFGRLRASGRLDFFASGDSGGGGSSSPIWTVELKEFPGWEVRPSNSSGTEKGSKAVCVEDGSYTVELMQRGASKLPPAKTAPRPLGLDSESSDVVPPPLMPSKSDYKAKLGLLSKRRKSAGGLAAVISGKFPWAAEDAPPLPATEAAVPPRRLARPALTHDSVSSLVLVLQDSCAVAEWTRVLIRVIQIGPERLVWHGPFLSPQAAKPSLTSLPDTSLRISSSSLFAGLDGRPVSPKSYFARLPGDTGSTKPSSHSMSPVVTTAAAITASSVGLGLTVPTAGHVTRSASSNGHEMATPAQTRPEPLHQRRATNPSVPQWIQAVRDVDLKWATNDARKGISWVRAEDTRPVLGTRDDSSVGGSTPLYPRWREQKVPGKSVSDLSPSISPIPGSAPRDPPVKNRLGFLRLSKKREGSISSTNDDFRPRSSGEVCSPMASPRTSLVYQTSEYSHKGASTASLVSSGSRSIRESDRKTSTPEPGSGSKDGSLSLRKADDSSIRRKASSNAEFIASLRALSEGPEVAAASKSRSPPRTPRQFGRPASRNLRSSASKEELGRDEEASADTTYAEAKSSGNGCDIEHIVPPTALIQLVTQSSRRSSACSLQNAQLGGCNARRGASRSSFTEQTTYGPPLAPPNRKRHPTAGSGLSPAPSRPCARRFHAYGERGAGGGGSSPAAGYPKHIPRSLSHDALSAARLASVQRSHASLRAVVEGDFGSPLAADSSDIPESDPPSVSVSASDYTLNGTPVLLREEAATDNGGEMWMKLGAGERRPSLASLWSQRTDYSDELLLQEQQWFGKRAYDFQGNRRFSEITLRGT